MQNVIDEPINLLALESSCDDTSIALLRANSRDQIPKLLSLAVQSQWEVHEKFGGVVPELASRAHLQNLLPCLSKVLKEANLGLDQISAFVATSQPGLIGCLLIAHTAAKSLSFLFGKPLISCNHLHAHLMSIYLEDAHPEFPYLSAVVSGGHTSLYEVLDWDTFHLLGSALDDAAGEAFDKGAKLLGLGFPGGPEIDRLSQTGDMKRYVFGKVQTKNLDFSFSGLKSELVRFVQREQNYSKADAAAGYQKSIIDHLLDKTEAALKQKSLRRLAIVGGVARNSYLRSRLENLKQEGRIESWFAPRAEFCTDNAAMVGVLGYRKFLNKDFSDLSEDVRSTSRKKAKAS